MKKILNILTILLVTIIISNCKLNNKSKISFEQYFDESYSNYEFLVKNPMLYNPAYYFPNLSEIRNKYYLKIFQEYTMEDDGTKYYSDGDTWYTNHSYYKFDMEGRIEMAFFIRQNNYGMLENLTYITYVYEKEKYVEKEIDLLKKRENIIEYNIRKEEEKLFFERIDQENSLHQIIFEKGKITQAEIWNGEYENKEGYIYYDDIMINNDYICNRDGTEELDNIYTYQKGVILKSFSPFKGGQAEQDYITNDKGMGKYTYKETRGKNIVTFSNYLERQYNKAGFLEYEIQRPLKDGNSGVYKIKKAKLLDEPDELLLKYFGDVIEKE